MPSAGTLVQIEEYRLRCFPVTLQCEQLRLEKQWRYLVEISMLLCL
jgi:hypothetical protein